MSDLEKDPTDEIVVMMKMESTGLDNAYVILMVELFRTYD